ncbi:sigma-54 dependent transcriptional regulator [Candidatus Kapaibacterium sp.]
MENLQFDRYFFEEVKKRYGIIGNSDHINAAVHTLMQAAPTDLSVLITGETGTGKEVFANAVHRLSKRSKFPFVSVNCGAIPETLLESELFGNEKGAFTGAVEQRIGFFETANKGTIFLDEIGEMPIGTQVKLLRVLESGEFSRLGSSVVHKVDVRVIAATNRDLELFVEQRKFRRDLYYRLNQVQIKLPELRNHPQDIPLLVEHFGVKVAEKLNLKYSGISSDALSILKSLPWTGNVRELKNMIDTVITLEKGAYITPENLRKYIPPALPAYHSKIMHSDESLVQLPKDEVGTNELFLIFKSLLDIKSEINEVKRAIFDISLNMDRLSDSFENSNIQTAQEIKTPDEILDGFDSLNLDQLEKKMIILALNRSNGNRRQAADLLGISERTLYRKFAEYGIDN